MNSHECDHIKGLIALNVIGRLPDAERVVLLSHLDGCRECRDDERELLELARVLPAADLGHLEEDEVPAGLDDAVLGRLLDEAARDRRSRRFRLGLAATAAAAAVVLALALVLLPGSSKPGTVTVALSGSSGVRASVVLTSETWGTAVRIAESGQPGRQVMWVSMHTKAGDWWQAGTYRSVSGHPVEVELACALKLSQIESVWVRNAAGRAVLHGNVS